MPASSQGLPTSRMRETGAPQPVQRDTHGIDEGTVGRVAFERLPAIDGSLAQLFAPTDDETVPQAAQS